MTPCSDKMTEHEILRYYLFDKEDAENTGKGNCHENDTQNLCGLSQSVVLGVGTGLVKEIAVIHFGRAGAGNTGCVGLAVLLKADDNDENDCKYRQHNGEGHL